MIDVSVLVLPGRCSKGFVSQAANPLRPGAGLGLSVERVHGRSKLAGLATMELTLYCVAITLQGVKIRRVAGDRITVTLPDFLNPRTNRMCTAIILSHELPDTIGSTVAQAYETLEHPTLPLDPARSVTGPARV